MIDIPRREVLFDQGHLPLPLEPHGGLTSRPLAPPAGNPPPRLELRTLGSVSVRPAGPAGGGTLVLQPKRVALLANLALAPGRGVRRRDALVALFWPELDHEHARAALSEALRYLRRAGGEDVVLTIGNEEVGVGPALWCDAVALTAAADLEDPRSALELYQGPFFDGFLVGGGSPELDQWIETERVRLAGVATKMAWRESDRRDRSNDPVAAVAWARRAVAIRPDDEPAIRRLIGLLDRVGDRAGALAAYRGWSHRLETEYQAVPSPETTALAASVRARDLTEATLPTTQRSASAPAGKAGLGLTESAPALTPIPRPAVGRPGWVSRPLWLLLTGLVALVAVFVARMRSGASTPEFAAPLSATVSLAVLPLDNATGDSTLDYLAHGLGQAIRISLVRSGAIRTIPAGVAAAFHGRGVTALDIGRRTGVAFVLEWRLIRRADSLGVALELVRTSGGVRSPTRIYQLLPGRAVELEARLADDILDQVAPDRARNRGPEPTRSATAHLLYLEGEWYQDQRGAAAIGISRDLMLKAIAADPLYADAYAGLARAYSGLSHTGAVPSREGFPRAEAAARKALEIDPGSAPALAVLANARASYHWDWAAAERDFKQAVGLDPDDARTRNLFGIMLRNLGRYDEAVEQFRSAARIAPLSRHYRRQVGMAFQCAGRLPEAIAEWKAALALDPDYADVHGSLAGVYAQLGRYDEALDELRVVAGLENDSVGRAMLAASHGDVGFHNVVRTANRRFLETIDRPGQAFVGPAERADAYLQLGQTEEMFRRLDQALAERDVRLLTFECGVSHLPFAKDPRWVAIKRRIGIP